MRADPAKHSVRHPFALSPNARVSLLLAGIAAAFYGAMIVNHLPS